MADIVNLRQARKARKRTEREQAAAENRRRFGRTGAEKKAEADERARAVRAIDAHRKSTDEV